MTHEIELTNVPAKTLAAVRAKAQRDTLGKTITSTFDKVYAFLRAGQIPHDGLNFVVYLDSDLNLEVGVQVPTVFESAGEVRCITTPSGLAAHAIYFGPYDKMGEAYAALEAWSKDSGKKLTGPSWEAYGHWNDDPAQLRTDIYFLVSDS